MPGGVSLGSAYYELTADNTQLLGAFVQSKAKAQEATQAIQAAVKAQTAAIQSGSQAAIQASAAQTKAAQGAIQSALQAQQRYESMAKAIKQSSDAASGGIGTLVKSGAALGLGFVGITSAAATAHAAISRITEVTQRANQAQFALNATYKTSAATFGEFAAAQAAATKRTIADVQESVTAFGSLSNRYAFTTDQVKELTKRSADLAAVKGKTTVDAAQRLEAALRGEAEAAEALGLTLNSDYLKKFADMTSEQRKNWESLDPLIKAQITYREILKQTDPLLGTAVKRTTEAAGASDRLKTAWDNLALTLGQNLTPAVQQSQGSLARWIEQANEWLKKHREIQAAQGISTETAISVGAGPDARPLPPGTLDPESTPEAQAQARRAASGQAAVYDDIRKRQEIAAAERRARIASELAEADKANDATVESAIRAIDRERKEKERWYDEERSRIEARRTYQLEDIEARKDAAIAALNEEKQAARDKLESDIEIAEREKKARLDAAEAAKDAAEAAIKEEERRRGRVREQEDRERDDERRAQDREREDARRTEDRAREVDHRDHLADIKGRREVAVEALDDEAEAAEKTRDRKLRSLDREIQKARDASQRRKRDLEDEADEARDASQQVIRGIEQQADAESDRHRRAMQDLEDERDARLAILDAQLAQLDAADRAEDAARRTSDLQKAVADAQAAAQRVRGTGTPEQIAAARGDLTGALRGGDEVSIANARERLAQLAGAGAEAIREADEKLAEAQQALRDQGVEDTRDAERDKLKAAQDAIKADIDARKRQEDERNRQRERQLDADRQAEQDRLASVLEGIAHRQQAEDDDLQKALRRLDRRKDSLRDETGRTVAEIKERRAASERASEEEERQENRRFERDTVRLQDRRATEDREREDFRREQDRVRDDERRAEDLALAAQLDAVRKNFEQERLEAEVHYNGPNGVITQLRKAIEASEREYSRRLAAANASFEAERKSAERVYTNPDGNGLLQLLARAREDEFSKLEQSKADWQAWSTAASNAIKAAMADLDTFIQRGANVPRIGGDEPAQRSAGSGKNTQASASSSRSGRSGKEVKGDLSSWLNDAIDITGVSDDWITGLHTLVRLESGGDPHNQNPNDVIDPVTGRNLGPAKGLLQMLQPTFDDAFRKARQEFPGAKDLPNDIFDPVSNAVASIYYIKKRYGHVDAAVKNHAARGGYDRGGLVSEPVIGWGTRTWRPYAFAENGPEYVVGRQQTAAMYRGGAGLIGSAPASAAMTTGAAMLAHHPGGTGQQATQGGDTFHYAGVAPDDIFARFRRDQRRQDALRGARGLLRGR